MKHQKFTTVIFINQWLQIQANCIESIEGQPIDTSESGVILISCTSGRIHSVKFEFDFSSEYHRILGDWQILTQQIDFDSEIKNDEIVDQSSFDPSADFWNKHASGKPQ